MDSNRSLETPSSGVGDTGRQSARAIGHGISDDRHHWFPTDSGEPCRQSAAERHPENVHRWSDLVEGGAHCQARWRAKTVEQSGEYNSREHVWELLFHRPGERLSGVGLLPGHSLLVAAARSTDKSEAAR